MVKKYEDLEFVSLKMVTLQRIFKQNFSESYLSGKLPHES